MNNKQLAEVAKILGVSEDSISAMDDAIKNSMTAVFETIAVRNDEDKKAVYEALDKLWQKGTIYAMLHEVARITGISLVTLRSLDYETQQTLVYEFMMDSTQTERFYELTNHSLAVMELDTLVQRADADKQDESDVDEYIRRLKSCADAEKLTRQMCLDLIEYFTVDAYQGRKAVRDIHIYYKLIDKPLNNKKNALA